MTNENATEDLMLDAIEQAIDLTVTLRLLLDIEDPTAYRVARRIIMMVGKTSVVKEQ